MSDSRRLPSSRIGRLSKLGRLAGGIVGGAMGEGVRQLAQGKRPSLPDMLMTPGNFQRLSDRLAEMRGAAMKIGQLISMEGGEFIPVELNELLARLRKNAYSMPLGQVAAVLNQNWGKGWQDQFEQFSFTPLASASIGQVHEARLKDGAHVAIKVQYPGVRDSIDADVNNVTSLLKMVSLVPKHLDLDGLLAEAKTQLHQEADYAGEAAHLESFADLLQDDDRFQVPRVFSDWTTSEVLTMEFLDGQPIESLLHHPQEERNRVGGSLLELSLRELFEWGLVQTDPNFANFHYQPDSGRIQLFDFGASRAYTDERTGAFRNLIHHVLGDKREAIEFAATEVGYLGDNDPAHYRDSVVQLISTACEPLSAGQEYDFGQSDLASRMADITLQVRTKQSHGQLPPPDVLFLHRKLGGIYLLLNRLGARVDVAALMQPHLDTA